MAVPLEAAFDTNVDAAKHVYLSIGGSVPAATSATSTFPIQWEADCSGSKLYICSIYMENQIRRK